MMMLSSLVRFSRKFVSLTFLVGLVCARVCLADPDIAFVGAGPVGLYTAIQAKLYEPNLKIHFFEKYTDYKRKHSVKINPVSFRNAHRDPEFRSLLKSFGKSVRTAVLEAQLLDLAKRQGITIEYKEIHDLQE